MARTNRQNVNTTPVNVDPLDAIMQELAASIPAALNGPVNLLTGSIVVRKIPSKPGALALDARTVEDRTVSAFYSGEVGNIRLARLLQAVKHAKAGGALTITVRAKTREVQGKEYLDLDA